jgi:hypothetical protein
MKSPLVLLQLPVIWAILGGATVASAEPFCRTVLPDGHIVLSRPVLDGNALVCRTAPNAQTVMPRGSAMATAPSMRFTTGTIGPFTTGEIGPFTTGEIGPFTTFPSSTPAAGIHR